MGVISWESRYGTGVELIDRENRALCDRLWRFQMLLLSQASEAELRHCFAKTQEMFLAHFIEEEALLGLLKRRQRRAHLKEHQTLRATLQAAEQDLEAGLLDYPKLVAALRRWLDAHLRGPDRILAELLAEQEASIKRRA